MKATQIKTIERGIHDVDNIALEMRVTTADGVIMMPFRAFTVNPNQLPEGKKGIALAMDAEQMGFIMAFMADVIPAIMSGLAKNSGVDMDDEIKAAMRSKQTQTVQ